MTLTSIEKILKILLITFQQLLIILLLFIDPAHADNEYTIKPKPEWIKEIKIKEPEEIPSGEISNGIYYLLADNQIKISDDVILQYSCFLIKVTNQKGTEAFSTESIDFDPSFESIILHGVNIHRKDKVYNKIKKEKISILQREERIDYQVYNGRKTILIILDDLRVGDIIELSYTRKGNNPIFKNRYFGNFYFQWSSPVGRVRTRILIPEKRKLFIKNHNTSIRPVITESDSQTEYKWTADNVSSLIVDNELPGWYDPYPMIQISEMESWSEVAKWACKLYTVPDQLSPELLKKITELDSISAGKEKKLLKALRFVQDEIHYMAIAIGPGSYSPRNPSRVMEQRFGDCKDKALLLVTILERLGIESRPSLVNTVFEHKIRDYHPTPLAFNHVIVMATVNGKNYWIDPTMSYQRGELKNISQPFYGYALIISDKTRQLSEMDYYDAGTTKIVDEVFDLRKGFKGQAIYTVKTVCTAYAADNMRNQFAISSKEELQKKYLNFYAKYYPSIKVQKKIEVVDEENTNTITATEVYSIDGIFKYNDKKKQYEAEFHPAELYTYFVKPDTIKRSMPLSINFPVNIDYKTQVLLPDEWEVEPSVTNIKDKSFLYSSKVSYKDKLLTMEYSYKSLTGHVEAKDTERYINKIKSVYNDMGYRISHSSGNAPVPSSKNAVKSTSNPNWSVILICLMSIIILISVSLRLYKYSPDAGQGQLELQNPGLQGISGWLIVLAIGLIASPFAASYAIIDNMGSYSLDTWNLLTTPGTDKFHPLWAPFLMLELLGNISLLVFAILLIVIFFRKKRSFPGLYIFFMLYNVLIIIIDHFGAMLIPAAAKGITSADTATLVRKVVYTAIWCVYLVKSNRVKSTFVN